MNYLRNIWYVVAWADEITQDKVLARTVLETPLALFRRTDGSTAALLDRCPHRFAPLSMGCVKGDTVVCGYHGLGFDGTGACTLNPHGPIRRSMGIPAYRTHEVHGAVWIWMGDQERADPALIPNMSYLTDAPPTAFSKGYLAARGNYEIFVDNIMDLSHADYLHPSTLGGAGVTGTKPDVVETEDHVDVTWFVPNQKPSPLLKKLYPDLPESTDTFQRVRWYAPGIMRLVAGSMAAGAPEEDALANFNAHILTPETSTSSHYFFAATRNFRVKDGELNAEIAAAREHIFGTEDKPMIEAIQNRMGDAEFWTLNPLLFSVDAAPVRVRRRLKQMIEAEQRRCDTLS